MTSTVLFISGPPGSGKTQLGRWLSSESRTPLISKDEIKERLFDSEGSAHRKESSQLGERAFRELTDETLSRATRGESFICESAFMVGDAALFERVSSMSQGIVINAHCDAPTKVLLRRFLERARTTRHPGHHDTGNVEELRSKLIAGEYCSLANAPFHIPTKSFSNDHSRRAREQLLKLLSDDHSSKVESGLQQELSTLFRQTRL